MSKQPRALELAENLQNTEYDYAPTGPFGQTETFYRTPNGSADLDEAAALLRSQHELIGELVEALRAAVDEVDGTYPFAFLEAASVAISKAKEQQ